MCQFLKPIYLIVLIKSQPITTAIQRTALQFHVGTVQTVRMNCQFGCGQSVLAVWLSDLL
jgi:hypothetical protein